jgi:hypothetical protein
VYGTANTFSFGLGQLRWLYVEVTPQNGAVTHYRFQVSVPMISSVSIGGNPVTNLGTADATFSGATAGSTVTLTDAAAATNLTIVATPPSGLGITVLYGTSTTAGTEPTNWSASLPSEQIPSGTYIGVKASAETTVNYYKFRITYGSNAFAVSAVTVAGKAPNSLGTPGTAYNTGVTVANIYLTSAQVTPGRQIVVTSANAVSIRVGTSTSNNTAPNNWVTLTKSGNTYTANLPGNALANNSTRIALEVTAEDNITIRFYKFLVMTANNAALTSLSVGGVSAAAANWGTPAGSWDTPNLVTGGTPLTLTSGAATNAVVIAAGGTNAGTITYAKTSDLTTEPSFAAAPEGGFTFANGDYLYVRLVYTTASNIYRNVYRIPIAVQ